MTHAFCIICTFLHSYCIYLVHNRQLQSRFCSIDDKITSFLKIRTLLGAGNCSRCRCRLKLGIRSTAFLISQTADNLGRFLLRQRIRACIRVASGAPCERRLMEYRNRGKQSDRQNSRLGGRVQRKSIPQINFRAGIHFRYLHAIRLKKNSWDYILHLIRS